MRRVTDDAVGLTSRRTRIERRQGTRTHPRDARSERVRPRARSTAEIVACRACPRLVAWREQVAREKRAAFRDETYWGRPVPGFGDPQRPGAGRRARARPRTAATAPAASSPATGPATSCSRRCTAPASPTSRRRSRRDDGLVLRDAYIAAAVRCAPPANKPTPDERDECRPYLVRELELLDAGARSIVVLGAFGYEALWSRARGARVAPLPRPRPRFAHGLEVAVRRASRSLGCFHPSQQNTFTGRLTAADARRGVRARALSELEQRARRARRRRRPIAMIPSTVADREAQRRGRTTGS